MPDPVAAFFDGLRRQAHVPTFEEENATIRFDAVTGNTIERWRVTVADGDVGVTRQNLAADSVVRMRRADLAAMVTGKLNAQAAVLRGLIATEGKLAAFMMFQRCLPGPPGSTGKVAPISGTTVMTWRRP
jgi:putative sterol carrier protein